MALDYGVKIPLTATVIIGDCFGCQVEGYALSEPDLPMLMDVCLIAEPMRGKDGKIIPADDVGEVVSDTDRDPNRAFFGRALMAEARRPENMRVLQDAWHDWHGDRRAAARADAAWNATKEARP